MPQRYLRPLITAAAAGSPRRMNPAAKGQVG